MRGNRILILVSFIFVLSTSIAFAWEPKDGYVPDEKTAIKIAEAVLSAMGGEGLKEEPFKVRLKHGVWFIDGKDLPKGMIGGALHLEISKKDGRILNFWHGQ